MATDDMQGGWCLQNARKFDVGAKAVITAYAKLQPCLDEILSSAHSLQEQEEALGLLAKAKAGRADEAELAKLSDMAAPIRASITKILKTRAAAVRLAKQLTSLVDQLQDAKLARVADAAASMLRSFHNTANCPLFALPPNALHSIARSVGPRARLVCRRLSQAYGPPCTALSWPPRPAPLPAPFPSSGQAPTTTALGPITFVSTWQWASHLTKLALPWGAPLPPSDLATIATHLPHLRSLACSWPEQPHSEARPPPALTALSALSLQPYDSEGNPVAHTTEGMAAFAQLPPLMPHLRDLALSFGKHPGLDASFPATVAQLGRGVTALTLQCRSCSDPQHVLPAVAALSGSLRHLHLRHPYDFGPGLSEAVACLTLLTCLSAQYVSRAINCLPPAPHLPSLQRLDLGSGRLHNSDAIAELAAWLASEPTWARSAVSELVLPRLDFNPDSCNPADVVTACAGFTRLTSLQFAAVYADVDEYYYVEPVSRRATGWPGALTRLTSLRRLAVTMDLEELGSIGGWGALAAVTHLSLHLHYEADDDVGLQELGFEEAVREGLGRMRGLRSVDLQLANVDTGEVAVRRPLLQALSALPALDVVDLGKAREEVGVEELEILAAGCARASLRQLVVGQGHCEELVGAAQELLPGASVKFVFVYKLF